MASIIKANGINTSKTLRVRVENDLKLFLIRSMHTFEFQWMRKIKALYTVFFVNKKLFSVQYHNK